MWETIAWVVIMGIFGFALGILVCTGFVFYLLNKEVDE
jgi:hypothetical protein